MDQIDELLKKANFISKQQERIKLPNIQLSSKSPKAYRAHSKLNVTQQYKIPQYSPKKGVMD
jgi:16S rRNA G527 N7-methylase RsmG